MRGNGLERIEARPEAVDKWVAEVNDVASKTLLPLAKHSWYLGGGKHSGQAQGVHVVRGEW